jgi:hypothetical protein
MLDQLLRLHPRLQLPRLKETKFFHDDHRKQYERGVQWYFLEYFGPISGDRLLGEVDPEYLFFPEAAARLHDHNPALRVLIILRHPVARAYSHYLMSKARGFESLSFEDALEAERDRLPVSEFAMNHYSYVARGLYGVQVERYVNLFGRQQLYVCAFEDFIDDPRRIMGDIFSFLRVPGIAIPARLPRANPAYGPRFHAVRDFVYKPSPLKSWVGRLLPSDVLKTRVLEFLERLNRRRVTQAPLDESTRQRLEPLYHRDTQQLQSLLGIDFASRWFR